MTPERKRNFINPPAEDRYGFGKLPPQAKDLEEAVIGACLLEPQELYKAVNLLSPEYFYVDAHQRIWRAVLQLRSQNAPVDQLTVVDILRKNGELDACGGAYFIATLTNAVGSAANVEYHCHIVKEKWAARHMISAASDLIKKLYEDTEDAFDAIDEMQAELLKVNAEINKSKEKSFSDAVIDRVHEIKKAGEDKTYRTGEIVHLDALDRQTMGWQKTDLIIIAGRPAMGKSAFAWWCALQQAKHNTPVGFISLEMSTAQLIDRAIAAESDIDLSKIRKGGMHAPEWSRFDKITGRMLDYPLYIDDRGGQRITQICNTVTNWVIKYGIKAVYIDYLQLIKPSGLKKGASREQDVSEVSQALKALAKNLEIPVIALSQLSRAVETRGGDNKPFLSDLRESGSIEQDADMVVFPFRPGYYTGEEDNVCQLIIAKYRNGEVGTVEVEFIGAKQKFRDKNYLTPYGSDDTPF